MTLEINGNFNSKWIFDVKDFLFFNSNSSIVAMFKKKNLSLRDTQ